MKKLVVILILASLCGAGISQGELFKPIPKDYFTSSKSLGDNSALIPRISIGLNAVSYGRNPLTKELEVTSLSAVIFGLSFLHYKNVEGLPFNDFGFTIAYLQLMDKVGSGLGLYGNYNTGQIGLLNIGGHWDFALARFFIDTGVTFHF